MHVLTVQAISAALAQQWDTAVTLNQKILQDDPIDYDALNRLAYAFFELGRLDEAQEMFLRVLELDPKNLIATRNLQKLEDMDSTTGHNPFGEAFHDEIEPHINPQLFLDEPGKTKTTHLIRIAAKEVLASLRVGLKLELLLKNRTIAVLFGKDVCIGYLPDDLSFSLCRFLASGSLYEAYVKSVTPNLVTVFIRELKKSDEFAAIPSFIDSKKRATPSHRTPTQEPPSALANEEAFDYGDEMEKDLFEVE